MNEIAEICHEVNRTYCQSLGDDSQKAWVDAPQWQRETVREGVDAIESGKVTSPQQSHVSWYQSKRADGWVYGEVKDEEAKTHPCLVPFNRLPPEQQHKDVLFFFVAKTLLGLWKVVK